MKNTKLSKKAVKTSKKDNGYSKKPYLLMVVWLLLGITFFAIDSSKNTSENIQNENNINSINLINDEINMKVKDNSELKYDNADEKQMNNVQQNDWITHNINPPLNISFKTPKIYKMEYVRIPEDNDEVWGTTIELEEGLKIDMCVGCQINPMCGTLGERCTIMEIYDIKNSGYFKIFNYKNTENFAEISGIIYNPEGGEISIQVIKKNHENLTSKDLTLIKDILNSVSPIKNIPIEANCMSFPENNQEDSDKSGYITDVYTINGKNYIDVDYILWLYHHDGSCSIQPSDSVPLCNPNGYLIVDESNFIDNLEISPKAKFIMQSYGSGEGYIKWNEEIDFMTFKSLFEPHEFPPPKMGGDYPPFVITIEEGLVTKITESYTP